LGARDSDRAWYTVVGVVGDMRRQGLQREPVPRMFESLAQNPPRNVDLFIRSSTEDRLTMAGAVQAAVRRAEKYAPIYGVAPLEEQLGTYLLTVLVSPVQIGNPRITWVSPLSIRFDGRCRHVALDDAHSRWFAWFDRPCCWVADPDVPQDESHAHH
jgi:hypothetical protein